MRRGLLFACLLALAVSLAFFLRRTRTGALPVADAPSAPAHVSAAEPDSVEDATTPAPTSEQQASGAERLPVAPGHVRVHGHVRFADTRAPVADAQVVIRYRGASDSADSPKTSLAESAPDGSYSASVPGGSLLVDAVVPQRSSVVRETQPFGCYIDSFEPLAKDLELRALQGDFELDLLLESGTSIHGVVLQAGDRQPIAGAEVLFENSMRKAFISTSGADGQFTIRGITLDVQGPFTGRMTTLAATHPDFVRAEQQLAGPDELGKWPAATLLLERGLLVGGIVVGATGEPVPEVELRLRPMHGSPQAGVCEFEGEWKTTSDTQGIFRFEKVPPFDRAWLVTGRRATTRSLPGVEPFEWHAATRTLLHGKDPALPALDLHLPVEVSVEFDVRYPDGTLATREQRLLLREDEDGRLRAARVGRSLACVAGRATRVVAWGKHRPEDEDGVVYRGETVVTVGANGADPHAEIRLAPLKVERREPMQGERTYARGAGSWANTEITLRFVDRASGEPIAEERLLRVEDDGGFIAGPIGKGATMRFYFEPGWETLKLTVEGYRAYTIELEVKDDEPQTLTLPLDRLR